MELAVQPWGQTSRKVVEQVLEATLEVVKSVERNFALWVRQDAQMGEWCGAVTALRAQLQSQLQ